MGKDSVGSGRTGRYPHLPVNGFFHLRKILCLSLILFMLPAPLPLANARDGQALVQAGFNYIRDTASVSLVEMTIHRPTWERTVTLKAWTLGEKDSLFTIIAPPKDNGNGTLKKGREMWIYNPKVNRVIKLPPSMMSQSWMGSDFSNNDLAKSDTLINEYSHTVTGTETRDGKTVYIIKSMPKPDAPVVWGMQMLKIREDNIFLEQAFFDEDLKIVKALRFTDIRMIGGKLYPVKLVMEKSDEPEKYTVVEHKELEFKDSLPPGLFTLSNLRNPRR
ncbi:outer membrane lipoprotein-sorting protein [Thermodesulfobacteriota bacterium]